MKNDQVLVNNAIVTTYFTTTELMSYVVYLYGGGTIRGTKSDLLEELKELFTSNGYTVLALGYLLAPNAETDCILETPAETFQLLNEETTQNQPSGLYGRSADGYLMLQLARQLQTLNLAPQFLVNSYGYTDLEFIKEPRELLRQAIPAKEIATTDQTKPAWDDPSLSRYLLHHYSIQRGLSPHFCGLPENKDWSVYAPSDETLKTFPPCFSTTNSSDEGASLCYSKKTGRTIPESTSEAVYYLEHDFLKQTKDPLVIALSK